MNKLQRIRSILTRLGLLALLCACTSVHEAFDQQALALKFEKRTMIGNPFRHIVYRHQMDQSKTLHVYLDGDGTIWMAGRPADDPTPRNSLVLRLMSLDTANSVYLGRPCYLGLSGDSLCSSRYWLDARYAKEVVDSLAALIRKLLAKGEIDRLILIGYSGGGALATLLAPKFPQTAALVTISAVLDTQAWSKHTFPNDLSHSLNPVDFGKLPASIRQYHYAGAEDEVVLPDLSAKATERLGATLTIINHFNHRCCWEQWWPEILKLAD